MVAYPVRANKINNSILMPPYNKLTFIKTFTHVHHFLDTLFLEHQVVLMHKDFKKALNVIHELYSQYEQHIRDEETILIPAYQNIVKPLPQGGAVDFFLREHKQIMLILEEAKSEIENWIIHSTYTPLKLVSLFDRYYTLRDLLNHHHAREDTFLYRLLDRNTDGSTQERMIEKIVLLPQKAGK